MGAKRSAAFDAAAVGYDADFSHSLLGDMLRRRLWSVLERHLPQRGRLLELGCGTGEDALHMAQRGAAVVATDVSAKMRAVTQRKCGDAPVEVAHLDLEDPYASAVAGPFDGAWSSFGPVNCVSDRGPLWSWLSEQLAPGASLTLVVMSPFAPWDWCWFGLHGQLSAATRRLREGSLAHAGAGAEIKVWYPSWRRLAREASTSFEVVTVRGLGVFLPVSEAGHLVDKAPRLFRAAAWLESRIDGLPPCRSLCDHYVLSLRRR